MNLDGTGVTKLVATNDYSLFPQWSPDGTRITIYEGDPTNTVELSALSLTGTRTPILLRRLPRSRAQHSCVPT